MLWGHGGARKLVSSSQITTHSRTGANYAQNINVVGQKRHGFAQQRVLSDLKIIFLDEADQITSSAQQALRRIIELYSNSTRFILSCNISSNIIEPIQSRCTILRYNKLSISDISNRLKYICGLENIEYSDSGIKALVLTSDGDLRCALNNLQATYYGFNKVTED